MTTTKYKERLGDVIISLGDGLGLVLDKIGGKRYFLEVHREINKHGKPTREYHRFARDENNRGIFNFEVSIKEEINSYFPKIEEFMNQNEKVQSVKLEIRVQK